MAMKLRDAVLSTIRRHRLLAAGDPVAVACSGGGDSVALLLLLHGLREELGVRLLVAHLNHRLRGRAADADEAFVRALAGRLRLEFISERADVAARARQQRSNLEEAGRESRLGFFSRLCAEGKADVVATAHTLDDQAETLLARLLRGTGVAGLGGIQPVLALDPGRLVRPLLEVRRADLRVFLRTRKQAWREDAGNRDRARARNRIRRELLPRLERLSPAAVSHLAQLAAQVQREENFWQVFLEERFRTLAHREASGWRIGAGGLREPLGDFYSSLGLTNEQARASQRAVAQRLVRRLVEAARGSTRQLTGAHVEQVLRLTEPGQSGRRVMLPGLEVERSFDLLCFHDGRRPAASYSYEVAVPGSVDIRAARRRLEFKLVAASELGRGYNGAKTAALDADALGRRASPLTVRNWRPGDGYQPLGASRPRKLKTLFQRARVPASERASYPVVATAGEIVWVPRFGVSAACAVGERTRTALVIVEEPLREWRG